MQIRSIAITALAVLAMLHAAPAFAVTLRTPHVEVGNPSRRIRVEVTNYGAKTIASPVVTMRGRSGQTLPADSDSCAESGTMPPSATCSVFYVVGTSGFVSVDATARSSRR
ncbi:MAG: hypothetical protein K1X57_16360 [Gemmataceae bacterium]|nr:hypothetical protein [Gemmataceae bacterium]